jgi:Arc/MetJ-type ribon-helix-helix transcriptional regulator
MHSTRQLSITLPDEMADEMADWVEDKTASGPA